MTQWFFKEYAANPDPNAPAAANEFAQNWDQQQPDNADWGAPGPQPMHGHAPTDWNDAGTQPQYQAAPDYAAAPPQQNWQQGGYAAPVPQQQYGAPQQQYSAPAAAFGTTTNQNALDDWDDE